MTDKSIEDLKKENAELTEVTFNLPTGEGQPPRHHIHAGVEYANGDKATVTKGAAKKLRERKLIK